VKPGTKVDAGRVIAALAKRYAAPEFALFEQVGNSTGYAANRWADAVAMSLWPSRGLDLYGFEVKVSRHDWQRELRNPSKAEDIAAACDFWFVVVSGPGILELSEVPAPWGVLELNGRGLRQVKPAERRTPAAELDRPLIAAILRRASEGMVPKGSIAARLEAAERAGREDGQALAVRGDEQAQRDLAELRAAIADFERESGVEIRTYGAGHIGKLFALAKSLNDVRAGWELRAAENNLAAALKLVTEVRSGTVPTDG